MPSTLLRPDPEPTLPEVRARTAATHPLSHADALMLILRRERRLQTCSLPAVASSAGGRRQRPAALDACRREDRA